MRDKTRTASYASSFGMDAVPHEHVSLYSRALGGVRSLSVRERTGADLVLRLTGRLLRVVLDPVLLVDEGDWVSLAGGILRTLSQPIPFFYI